MPLKPTLILSNGDKAQLVGVPFSFLVAKYMRYLMSVLGRWSSLSRPV